jgi:hypothetical protein
MKGKIKNLSAVSKAAWALANIERDIAGLRVELEYEVANHYAFGGMRGGLVLNLLLKLDNRRQALREEFEKQYSLMILNAKRERVSKKSSLKYSVKVYQSTQNVLKGDKL